MCLKTSIAASEVLERSSILFIPFRSRSLLRTVEQKNYIEIHFERGYISAPANIQDREILCRSRKTLLAHIEFGSPLAVKALGAARNVMECLARTGVQKRWVMGDVVAGMIGEIDV